VVALIIYYTHVQTIGCHPPSGPCHIVDNKTSHTTLAPLLPLRSGNRILFTNLLTNRSAEPEERCCRRANIPCNKSDGRDNGTRTLLKAAITMMIVVCESVPILNHRDRQNFRTVHSILVRVSRNLHAESVRLCLQRPNASSFIRPKSE
jgi:hypothetical protein